MAVCSLCKGEMLTVPGCLATLLRFTPKAPGAVSEYERIRNGGEERYGPHPPHQCNDCGAAVGEYHHPGCDIEECPRCHLQLLSCDCSEEGTFADVVKNGAEKR